MRDPRLIDGLPRDVPLDLPHHLGADFLLLGRIRLIGGGVEALGERGAAQSAQLFQRGVLGERELLAQVGVELGAVPLLLRDPFGQLTATAPSIAPWRYSTTVSLRSAPARMVRRSR